MVLLAWRAVIRSTAVVLLVAKSPEDPFNTRYVLLVFRGMSTRAAELSGGPGSRAAKSIRIHAIRKAAGQSRVASLLNMSSFVKGGHFHVLSFKSVIVSEVSARTGS